jgi:hypothetical protein
MTGRHFILPQKWNKYAYVQNNPLMRVDPDGNDYIVFRYAIDIRPGSPTFGKDIMALNAMFVEWGR